MMRFWSKRQVEVHTEAGTAVGEFWLQGGVMTVDEFMTSVTGSLAAIAANIQKLQTNQGILTTDQEAKAAAILQEMTTLGGGQ